MQQEVKSVEALLNKAVLLMNGAELLELLHQVKGTEVKEEKKSQVRQWVILRIHY